MPNLFIIVFLLITVIGRAQVSGPSLGSIAVYPTVVTAGVPTSVFVTANITNSLLISSSVNLVRLNGSGASVLTRLFDDGTNGDVTANDHVFSARVTLNEPQAGQVQLQVSAAFTGFLTRSTSPVQTVTVMAAISGTQQYSNVFYQFSYPSQYTLTVKQLLTTHQLNSRGRDTYGLTAIDLVNQTNSAIDGIFIESWPNLSQVPVASILSSTLTAEQQNQLPGDTVQTVTINGRGAVATFSPSFDHGTSFRLGTRQVVLPTDARTYIFRMTWKGEGTNNLTSPVHSHFDMVVNSFSPF